MEESGILALAAMGLLAGVGTRTGRHSEMWNPDMAARDPRELPRSRLLRLRGLVRDIFLFSQSGLLDS
jgi:hypothetical protein